MFCAPKTYSIDQPRAGKVDTYFGHSLYTIDTSAADWKITAKRVLLDMDLLYPGKVIIIL